MKENIKKVLAGEKAIIDNFEVEIVDNVLYLTTIDRAVGVAKLVPTAARFVPKGVHHPMMTNIGNNTWKMEMPNV